MWVCRREIERRRGLYRLENRMSRRRTRLEQSKRDICEKIFQSLDRGSERNMAITLKWIPAAAKLPGHLAAHNAARAMTETVCTPSRKAKNRIYERAALQKLLAENAADQNQQNPTLKVFGRFTWRLDAALPGKHTLGLYDQLTQHRTAILVQARSGHNHLNAYRARIKAVDSDRCSCN